MQQLVMLPGTLCTHILFEAQIKALSELVDSRVIDIRNHDNLGHLASDILSSLPEKFSLMGLSYGGIIAFEILRQAPERIERLILLNTNHRKPSPQTIENAKKFVDMTKRGRFEEVTKDILIDAMLHPNHAKDEKLRAQVLQMAIETGSEGFLRQIKAQQSRPDSSQNLIYIKCPTLIITGREDKICPIELHREMHNLIPNSTLEIIENCGHLSTLEAPKKLNQIIKSWWN